MRKALRVGALLGATLIATPLQAQSATYRIKLYEPWSIRIAPVVRTTLADRMADSLPLTDKHGTRYLVPRRHVIAIDSLTATIPGSVRMRRGAVNGALSGAVIGAIVGLIANSESRSKIANGAVMGGIGLGTGALVGGVAGRLRSGEEWRTVWPIQP